MATYKEIQEYVNVNFGYIPKTCWIAHSKEIYGLSPKTATNRKFEQTRIPMPRRKTRRHKEGVSGLWNDIVLSKEVKNCENN